MKTDSEEPDLVNVSEQDFDAIHDEQLIIEELANLKDDGAGTDRI